MPSTARLCDTPPLATDAQPARLALRSATPQPSHQHPLIRPSAPVGPYTRPSHSSPSTIASICPSGLMPRRSVPLEIPANDGSTPLVAAAPPLPCAARCRRRHDQRKHERAQTTSHATLRWRRHSSAGLTADRTRSSSSPPCPETRAAVRVSSSCDGQARAGRFIAGPPLAVNCPLRACPKRTWPRGGATRREGPRCPPRARVAAGRAARACARRAAPPRPAP